MIQETHFGIISNLWKRLSPFMSSRDVLWEIILTGDKTNPILKVKILTPKNNPTKSLVQQIPVFTLMQAEYDKSLDFLLDTLVEAVKEAVNNGT